MTEANLISLFSFEQALLDQLSGHEIVEIQPGTVVLEEQEYIQVVPLVLEGSIKLRRLDPTGSGPGWMIFPPGEGLL